MKKFLYIIAVAFTASCGSTAENTPQYCNPLDLDYGWGGFHEIIARASADPVIVLFKDKYYLFATHDTGGYRVSDDLCTWESIQFDPAIRNEALNWGRYVAPAVAADDDYIYFIKLNRDRNSATTPVIRSGDPQSGMWEVCGEIPRVDDPSLFIDNGRYFVYHGLGTVQSIKCFELDPQTMTMIPGSEKLLLDHITDVQTVEGGYHFGRRELWDEIDARDWGGTFSRLPCPEGSWIVRHGGKYYLQFATPGTLSIWYCDVVMVGDDPTGPFTVAPYNPVSLKVGGFAGSAGHSCVFEDRYGNWWEVTTMRVGNADPFERRLGLFPVTFDEQGRMKVHTDFGDYPMQIPQRRFDPEKESLRGWNMLSFDKKATASSSLEGHDPSLAVNEDIRSWWSARSGDRGEWIAVDLGRESIINAVQVDFAEQNADTTRIELDYTAYRIEASDDGEKWQCIADRSSNTATNPHDYAVLPQGIRARYIRVNCERAMMNGLFAVRGLRVFGDGLGDPPCKVTEAKATRNRDDERFSLVEWQRTDDADGYMVHFGYSPDYLNLNVQVKGNDRSSLQLHILTRGQPYWYRIDTYNDSGVTRGEVFAEM